MPPQGELRGPKAQDQTIRRGGGDWDANEDDFAEWVEPQPGEQCKAFLMGITSVLMNSDVQTLMFVEKPRPCTNMAPVGSSICTPCHRRRIRARYKKLSLEHRRRISARTGKPLSEIQ